MKKNYTVISSETYDINPKGLRALRVELIRRNQKNAYRSHPEHKGKSSESRARIYDALKEKIRREGFRRDCPITIMLNRKGGSKDKILQGHHRLAMAIELDLPTVPVRFVW